MNEKQKKANSGKVAIITGAGQGIGRAIAERLAQDGFKTGILDFNVDTAIDTAERIERKGGKAVAVQVNVAERAEVIAAVNTAAEKLGGVDVLVNNAGVGPATPLETITPELYRKVFDVNVGSIYWGIQAVLPYFKQRKPARKGDIIGKIINASSIAGQVGQSGVALYGATKFAIRGITQTAARDLAPLGIAVNAYCPGIVRTAMMEGIAEKHAALQGKTQEWELEQWAEKTALGRLSKPEDAAACVSYLAGPDSDYMTGQALIIDGGIVFN